MSNGLIRCRSEYKIKWQTQSHPRNDVLRVDVPKTGFGKDFPALNEFREGGYNIVRKGFVMVKVAAPKKYFYIQNISLETALRQLLGCPSIMFEPK